MKDPNASGGIDLDSDFIIELAEQCPNICGVKLTYVVLALFLLQTESNPN